MLKDTINEFIKKIYTNNDAPKQNEQKIKLRNLLWSPLQMLFANIKEFSLLSLPFAFLMTFLALAFNNSITCEIALSAQNTVNCFSKNELFVLLFQILRLAIITYFIKAWYKYAIEHNQTGLAKIFTPTWQDAKIFFVLLFFIFINVLPAFSYFALLVREPNPNWIIESIYFLFVSIGFALPLLAILYYVILTYIIEGKRLPSLRQISAAVFSNVGKITISTLFTITIGLLIIIYYIGSITPYMQHLSHIKAALFEVFYNIVLLISVAIMTNYIFNLRDILFLSEERE